MVQIIDFFIGGLQAYMLSHFVCRYIQIKHTYVISMIISILGLYMQYFVLNYYVFDMADRIVIGMLGFSIIGMLIFRGSVLLRLVYSLIEYAAFTILDFLVTVVFFPWMGLLVSNDLLISDRLLLGRSLYNVTLYLVVILLEYLLEKKTVAKKIYLLAVFLGMSQICIMYCMYENDPLYIAQKAMMLSVIYNGVVILGYLVMKELFRKIMAKEKKQSELEQISLEMKYQYELYQKSLNGSEQIRNLRHDMRNQLQTIRFLLYTENSDEKERALKILSEFSKEIG